MTDHLVRVFRTDGKIERDRFAVWGGDRWIQLEAMMVTVVDSDDGAVASIVLACHVGRDLEPPKGTLPPRSAPAFVCLEKGCGRKLVCRMDEPRPDWHWRCPEHALHGLSPVGHEVPTSCSHSFENVSREIGYGGTSLEIKPTRELPQSVATPSAPVDKLPLVRFFTITSVDGRTFPNVSTNVAESDAAAAERVRARWNTLCQGQPGRQAAKVELQAGRVGTDRPDLAPPRGASSSSSAELDGDDHIG